MEEAQRLCDRIAIMDHGRIIAEGGPATLVGDHFPAKVVRLPWRNLPEAFREQARHAGAQAEIFTEDVGRILDQLGRAGVDLAGLQVETPSLEDLFLELTGHSLRS